MATLTRIITKANVSDPWIVVTEDTYITQEQIDTIIKPFWTEFTSLPGFQSNSTTYSEDGSQSTITTVFDTLENLESAIAFFKTSDLGKQRFELFKVAFDAAGIAQYTVEDTIT